MELEFHELDRRLEHLRVRRPDQKRRLLVSLAALGQQTPIVVVEVGNQPNRYLVIDGYKRIAALEQLGQDTVAAVIWPMSAAEAVVLDRSMRMSERETPLEEGWLLAELEQRFGYGRGDEVPGAGGAHQPGQLSTNGRGIRPTPIQYPASGSAVCGVA